MKKKSYLNNRARWIHNFCTIVQIVNLSKNIYKKPLKVPVRHDSRKMVVNVDNQSLEELKTLEVTTHS